jgi:hypothetical protein
MNRYRNGEPWIAIVITLICATVGSVFGAALLLSRSSSEATHPEQLETLK